MASTGLAGVTVEGTGLELSLTSNIIRKDDDCLAVETKEGIGSEFLVVFKNI